MISRRYIVYVIFSRSTHLRDFFCDPYARDEGKKGKRETKREREEGERRDRTLPGKTMIGRRSLETCLLGPGKCTTKGSSIYTAPDQDQRGEMRAPRGTFFLLMTGEPPRRRSRLPMIYIKWRWSSDSVISGLKNAWRLSDIKPLAM